MTNATAMKSGLKYRKDEHEPTCKNNKDNIQITKVERYFHSGMVQRGRSLRSDLEMTAAQGHGKSSSHLSSTVAGHPARHFRQFSTKSRTRSTASFKGLHRIITHDGTTDIDSHSLSGNSFKKSKSSDSLYRKRAISGLNMTALGRVKSNPSHVNRSRSGSNASSHSLAGSSGSTRLRPSRSKSTHSVLDLHDGDELYDNETTTDEEVEYFTDEEDEEDDALDKSADSEDSNRGDEREDEKKRFKSEESILLSKTFSDLTVPFQEKHNDGSLMNPPRYKAPSNLIKHQPSREEQAESENKIHNGFHNSTNSTKEDADNENGKIDRNIADEDGDDHIGDPDLNVITSNSMVEDGTHSLKRQGNKFMDPGHEEALQQSDRIPGGGTMDLGSSNYMTQRRESNTEQYIPSIILSQSTGVERRFEQPASIQNSLSNNYHVTDADQLERGINGNNMDNNIGNGDNKTQVGDIHTIEEPPEYQKQYLKGTNTNTNQHNFSGSISSLTNSLQRTVPENYNGTTRMNHLLNKKSSQNSLPRSDPRSLMATEPPNSSLYREDVGSASTINNFAQFLKSDSMDGESRTQRKLWLQRENSIMDLSSQNDNNDPIFMASNVEVKREFERISHEYTNVRRFSNPVEEALSRVESEQKIMGFKRQNKTNSDIVDTLFPSYGNRDKRVDQFLPKSENTKLHRILSSIWKEESALFNKDTNPLSRQVSSSSSHHILQSNRNSLRGAMGSGAALQHQRMINSLQPTTRAVNRRMENAINYQQRL